MEDFVSYFEHRYGLNPVAVFFSVLLTTVGMFIHVWWTTRPKPRKEESHMLCLSFKQGARVQIDYHENDGPPMWVTVKKVTGGTVLLGFDAGDDGKTRFPVRREEVIEREKKNVVIEQA